MLRISYLTKEQAIIKSNNFNPAQRKVTYIEMFDKSVVFRKGKLKGNNTTIDKIRYLEDERPMYRIDKITNEQILKSEEIITYVDRVTKQLFVLKKSGGISLFDMVNPIIKVSKNECWYGLYISDDLKKKKLPDGLIIAKDKTPNRDGITHYSIQPAIDMQVGIFKNKLLELAIYMKAI